MKLLGKQSHSAWLTSEIERLGTMLRPASQVVIVERLKILFATLPMQNSEGEEAMRLRAYIYALEGVSAATLDQVVKDILQGRIASFNLAFAPTAPQLGNICRERDDTLRVTRARRQAELERELAPLSPLEPMPSEAELQRRAEKAAAASRMIEAAIAGTDMRRVLPRRAGETERAAEARQLAARLTPATDAEIAAMQEAQP